jgi:hypothetical protein
VLSGMLSAVRGAVLNCVRYAQGPSATAHSTGALAAPCPQPSPIVSGSRITSRPRTALRLVAMPPCGSPRHGRDPSSRPLLPSHPSRARICTPSTRPAGRPCGCEPPCCPAIQQSSARAGIFLPPATIDLPSGHQTITSVDHPDPTDRDFFFFFCSIVFVPQCKCWPYGGKPLVACWMPATARMFEGAR